MEIKATQVKVADLIVGYTNNPETGLVSAYDGALDVRPAYQREYVYGDKQRNAVIDTVLKGFPLNTMYWVRRKDGSYEVLDGQQRTLSICDYTANKFTVDGLLFRNQPKDIRQAILAYPLTVYICEGTESARLQWFETINIAGVALTDQELRNATYTGPWLSDAKGFFSRPNAPAYALASRYLKGVPINQDYLETALKWISKGDIVGYMAKHQHDPNASEIWAYFRRVINWVQTTFPAYRSEMKGLPWGDYFNTYGATALNPVMLAAQVDRLMLDKDVTKKSGIYAYVLSGDERHLNIRAFDEADRRVKYEEQQGVCPSCGGHFAIGDMQADHITPWSRGGKTELANMQMLCRPCNARKSNA